MTNIFITGLLFYFMTYVQVTLFHFNTDVILKLDKFPLLHRKKIDLI